VHIRHLDFGIVSLFLKENSYEEEIEFCPTFTKSERQVSLGEQKSRDQDSFQLMFLFTPWLCPKV